MDPACLNRPETNPTSHAACCLMASRVVMPLLPATEPASQLATAVLQVLMVVGPKGMGSTDAARLAEKLNLADREMKQASA